MLTKIRNWLNGYFEIPNPFWDPYYAFVATSLDAAKDGLIQGETYSVKTDRKGRALTRPVLLGHVPTLGEQITRLVPSMIHRDVPRHDRNIIYSIDTGIVIFAITLFAIIVVALSA